MNDEIKKAIAQQDEYIRHEYTRILCLGNRVRAEVKRLSDEVERLTDRVSELELDVSDKPRQKAKRA